MTERLLAEWTESPFTGLGKRGDVVEHRILANTYPGVGVDLRHEVRCPDKGRDQWEPAEVWEVRSHGTERVEADARWWT